MLVQTGRAALHIGDLAVGHAWQPLELGVILEHEGRPRPVEPETGRGQCRVAETDPQARVLDDCARLSQALSDQELRSAERHAGPHESLQGHPRVRLEQQLAIDAGTDHPGAISEGERAE